jgi:outer membrane autotransporter protein
MKKNLRSKILLCVLAGGVLAANTALAAEYTESISSGNENYSTEIKSSDANGNYTYNFGQEAKLVINNESRGISLDYTENSTANKIIINNKLDISVTNKNNANPTHGIYLQGNGDKEIDRSNGGNINVLVDGSELNAFAMGSGVFLTALSDSDNNVIKIGNAEIDVQVLNAKYGVEAYGLNSGGTGDNNKIIMGNGSINITANSVSEEYDSVLAHGIAAYDNTEIETGDDVAIAVTASGNENIVETRANGIVVDGEDYWSGRYYNPKVITGNGDITATANGGIDITNANGVSVAGGTIEKGTGDIKAEAIGGINSYDVWAQGIYAEAGAVVTKGNGNITAIAQGGELTTAYGVRNYDSTVNLDVVNISAVSVNDGNNTPIVYGIYAEGNDAEVNMQGGSITAQVNNADGITDDNNNDSYAIFGYDSSVVNINQGTTNNVVIKGDIKTGRNAAVNLNLNTADSILTGSIEDENGTLNLENDASWIATGYSEVNKLTMNQGNIYVDTPSNIGDITINEYSGVGNIIFKADNTDEDGIVNINTSSFIISDAIENSFINVGVSNASINTLDFNKAEENLNTLAGKVYYDGDKNNLNGKVIIKEGLITPEVSGDLLFDSNRNRGYVANVKQNSSTTTIDNIKNIAATAIVAWRQEDSTLSQRLGELRESDGGQGIWVRMSRGEFEYDGEYKNQYNFFQMGYDWAAGSWHYGAAVSHNDGQTTYTHGDGENRSTSLSLYGTWLGDKGHYADIVLKQGRLSNDFDIYTEAGHTNGDYDAWGTSLSGEYGMKVDLDGGWYVTPQAQLTLMRIGGEDYTTNNGIKVNQDSLESAVGRVGFEVGKRISDSGSIYAKASLLHDFAGSADTYLSHKGLTNSYHQDIGDTWCEAGIGFNYKTSENSYVYADVVKTFGGDVETPWQWNAGMRWTF